MKYYTITVYIKREIQKGFEKNTYKYRTIEEGKKGWEQIGKDLERLMNNHEIVTFQLEADFQAV